MNWRIKGVAQKVLAVAPGGRRVNDRLQVTLGGLQNFEANVDLKVIQDWCVLASHMAELKRPLQDLEYVEIGTGWYPTSPVCYFLAGAKRCLTLDVSRKINEKWTFRMLRRLKSHLPAIAGSAGLPESQVAAAYAKLESAATVDELLKRAQVEYRAPADAARTGLPAASVDVVFSNSVLEHVTPEAMASIFAESRRILRPGGVAVHSANCGDHYAYFDRRITAINYLTYSTESWRFWDNSLLYQNRMRPQDFLEVAERAGFKVVLSKFRPHEEILKRLPHMNIAPEFMHYVPEQLASTSIDFVAECQ